jgi:hypothetical protein
VSAHSVISAVPPDVGAHVGIGAAGEAGRMRGERQVQEDLLEAATGVEPVIKVLQLCSRPDRCLGSRVRTLY